MYTWESLLQCTSLTQVHKHYRCWKNGAQPTPHPRLSSLRTYCVTPLIWFLHQQLCQAPDRWDYFQQVQRPVLQALYALCEQRWKCDFHWRDNNDFESQVFVTTLKYLRPGDFIFIEHHAWPCQLLDKKIWGDIYHWRNCEGELRGGAVQYWAHLKLSIANRRGNDTILISQGMNGEQSRFYGPFPILLTWSVAFNQVRRQMKHRWRCVRYPRSYSNLSGLMKYTRPLHYVTNLNSYSSKVLETTWRMAILT